jgi:hypothetical protein
VKIANVTYSNEITLQCDYPGEWFRSDSEKKLVSSEEKEGQAQKYVIDGNKLTIKDLSKIKLLCIF